MKGDTLTKKYGVYGTQGVTAASNKPGTRSGSASWTDASGNVWMFGGDGNGATTVGSLNDLWKYNPSTNQYTWVKGDITTNNTGVYGSLGSPAPGNKPGARSGSVTWMDASGNFWLFGGYGYSSTTNGILNGWPTVTD